MIEQRKKEHIEKTMAYVRAMQSAPDFEWTTSDLQRMLGQSFDAGKNAESDRALADRMRDMDAERRRQSTVIPFGFTDAAIARIEAASLAAQGEGAAV
jgi:hypothetical protein